MGEVLRGFKPIAATVHVGDGNTREFLVRDILEAAEVDAVHLANGRLGSDTEGAYAAMFAEEVQVLGRVEQVLCQLGVSGDQTKVLRLGNGWPEASSSAYRAVAPIGGLGEIEIGFDFTAPQWQHLGRFSALVIYQEEGV
jgi:hypothetical protein